MTTAIKNLALSVYPYAYSLFADDMMVTEFFTEFFTEALMRFVVTTSVDELDQLSQFKTDDSSLESICYQLYKLGLEKKELIRFKGIDPFFSIVPYEARSILFLKMKWHWSIERIAKVMQLTSSQVMLELDQGRGLLYQAEIQNHQESHAQ